MATDLFSQVVNSGPGSFLAKQLGVPQPQELRRYRAGEPPLAGSLLIGGEGRDRRTPARRAGRRLRTGPQQHRRPLGRHVRRAGLRRHRHHHPRGAQGAARVLHPGAAQPRPPAAASSSIGTTPEETGSVDERIAQRALEGFTRSLGKELQQRRDDRPGLPVRRRQARRHRPRVHRPVPAVGQVGLRRRPGVLRRRRRLGRRPPTGTSRSTARSPWSPAPHAASAPRSPRCSPATAPRSVLIDVDQAAEALAETATKVGGTALTLDVTAADAVDRIAEHLRALRDTTAARPTSWSTTRASPATSCWPTWTMPAGTRSSRSICLPRNASPRAWWTTASLGDGGRIVGLSSMAGIAGNRGQTNYAATKAGMIGMTQALAPGARPRRASPSTPSRPASSRPR